MNNVILFLPTNNLEQRKAQEKMLIEDVHSSVHVLSIPGRLIQILFEALYLGPYCENVNKILPEQLNLNCEKIDAACASIGKKIEATVPNSVKNLWEKSIENLQKIRDSVTEKWFTEYNISKKTSCRFFESAGYSLSFLANFGTAKVMERLIKHLKHKPKIDYSSYYEADLVAFASARKISGILNKEITIVRYHTEESILNKSHKWWTSTKEANLCDTMEKVKERLALLDSFGGKKTFVSVAVIPKGTKLECYYGKAAPQSFAGSIEKGLPAENLIGGGFQLRLKHFSEDWIRETRSLNGKSFLKKENTKFLNPTAEKSISWIAFPTLKKIKDMFFLNNVPLYLTSKETKRISEEWVSYISEAKDLFQISSNPSFNKVEGSGSKEVAKSISLNSNTSLEIHPSLTHPKQSTIRLTADIGNNASIGIMATPFNWKQTCITASVPIHQSPEAETNLGVQINPIDLKQSTVSLTQATSNGAVYTIVNPFKIKSSQIQASTKISDDIHLDFKFAIDKPLNSLISAKVPTTVCGVPFNVSIKVCPKNLEGAKVTVSLPLKILDKAVAPLGIKLPSELPLASITIKKAPKNIEKGIKKTISATEKAFKSIFGGKSKKRKKRQQEQQLLTKQAQEFARQQAIEIEKTKQKILDASNGCHQMGTEIGFIVPGKTTEDYFFDITMDWHSYTTEACIIQFPGFIEMIAKALQNRDFNALRHFSPIAHAPEPLLPQQLTPAFNDLTASIHELQHAHHGLTNAIQQNSVADQHLKQETTTLGNLNDQLGNLLNSKEKRLEIKNKFKHIFQK